MRRGGVAVALTLACSAALMLPVSACGGAGSAPLIGGGGNDAETSSSEGSAGDAPISTSSEDGGSDTTPTTEDGGSSDDGSDSAPSDDATLDASSGDAADSSTTEDASADAHASDASDSSTADAHEDAHVADSGSDTGTTVDAAPDTGTVVDAAPDTGTEVDAGPDTGTVVDAAPDTGSAEDAALPDAGPGGSYDAGLVYDDDASTIAATPLADLSFAIIGNTAPGTPDAGYPTTTVSTIATDLENASPRPFFVVGTGNYVNANSASATTSQLAALKSAISPFTNPFFPGMGYYECNGSAGGNCGAGNANGVTTQYSQFISSFLAPITTPYYAVQFAATDGTWTANVIVTAPNAWDTAQSNWLAAELAIPATYIFVVCAASTLTASSPGMVPIHNMAVTTPVTMIFSGELGVFDYPGSDEMIVGNGGAPLVAGYYYGYVLAARRDSDGAIVFTSYDESNVARQTFAVTALGDPTP
jgi:hypothetical protein